LTFEKDSNIETFESLKQSQRRSLFDNEIFYLPFLIRIDCGSFCI